MADDPKAGTPDDTAEGGIPEDGTGTLQAEPEGGTDGAMSPEDAKAELERLRAAQKQWLGEKDAYARKLRELEERAATPPTPDPSLQSRIDAERERVAALERAAANGDPVAADYIEFKRQALFDLQLQKIHDPDERDGVRALMAKFPGRFADVDVARFTLRGLRAEYESRQPAPTPTPKPAPPKPTVATGARNVAPASGGGSSPMPFSEYLAAVNRGGPRAEQLQADKDAGRLLIDYAK